MKAQERHHLKENEFAVMTAWVVDQFTTHLNRLLLILGGAAILGVLGLGYLYVQNRNADEASTRLGAALAIAQSPVVPASTVPGAQQAPGTYSTEAARGEAAIAALRLVINDYSSNDTGTAARYHLGSILLSLGRADEAERTFAEAATKGGASLYGEMAKLGHVQALVALQKFDDAIKELNEVANLRETKLPVDGVLMELARVCRKAGKMQEARAAFKRVVDEFPESAYADEARKQLATLG